MLAKISSINDIGAFKQILPIEGCNVGTAIFNMRMKTKISLGVSEDSSQCKAILFLVAFSYDQMPRC